MLSDIANFIAGHSLGEYSALTAAGSLRLADTAHLLKLRGKAMQSAVAVDEGKMVAIIGLGLGDVEEVAEAANAFGICDIANDNAPGQVVLSGGSESIEHAMKLASEKGARRVLELEVSAPFHCRLLKPAAEVMAEALETVVISAPSPPLVANVLAEPVDDPNLIRGLLVDQVTQRVRWRESILFMKSQGVSNLVELGTGKVLTNLCRRIDKELSGHSIEKPADIEEFIKSI